MRKIHVTLFIPAAVLLWAVGGRAAETVKVGDPAPAFTLPFATRDSVDLKGLSSAELAGKRYVLAFYPADWSSGCTAEMCMLRDEFAGFEKLGVIVLPVSGAYVFSHREWAQYHNLPFRLLSDPTREFGRKMGVYREDTGMFQRSVFVVGPTGTLEYVDYEYSVKDRDDFEALRDALGSAESRE